MKNACRQCSIRFSVQKSVTKVLLGTCPARCDNWDRKFVGESSQCFVGITIPYPIMIHTGEQNLPGSPLLCFVSPGKEFTFRFYPSPIEKAAPSRRCMPGIYSQHTYLRAKMTGYIANKLRSADGCRIDRYFIGSGVKQTLYITQLMYPTSYGKRDIDVSRYAFYQRLTSISLLP